MELKKGICSCGKKHTAPVDEVAVGSGIISRLPEFIRKYNGGRAFILADNNTYKAAGKAVCKILSENSIAYSKYIFQQESLEPDETAVGSAVMHFDEKCDIIIGVGSGVINDIGKILSNLTGSTYIIVATAPSMDGYASATSSMAMDGVKVTLPSKCASVIIGDTDILRAAPISMLKAGIGDMLAKYISICEWRLGNLITGEYYCEEVANLIRNALRHCTDNVKLLLKRDEGAVKAVFEGLVAGGIAMAYAGVSRPASGVEHYFSHIWDMRGLEFGTRVDLHGIQCAIGTLITAKLYEQIKLVKPDRQRAIKYVQSFDYDEWSKELRGFLGKSSEAMIDLEKIEQKYSVSEHKKRIDIIIENWDKILEIINEELPPYEAILDIVKEIDAPLTTDEIGIDKSIIPLTFKATKDIRDKYILSRLAWDLGVIDGIF